MPDDVQIVVNTTCVNQTHTYQIDQILTQAVVHEMITRTRYRIVNQADNGADATLRGTVLSTATSPLTYDSTTGRASSVLVVVTMKVAFTDRQGKVLYENPAYLFREQYQVSRELN